ncbi:MAG TPA: hypothetical protein VGB13_07925 [Candidatus Krumholzibacteria bacterium]
MDVQLEVRILNIVYVLQGFEAIKELKYWLDEHASGSGDGYPPPMLPGTEGAQR